MSRNAALLFICPFRSCFLALALLFFALPALSQNRDSLRAVWNDVSRDDTSRLKAIDKLCQKYYFGRDPDSCIYFSELAYNLAEKKGLKKYMGKAMAQMGNGYMTKGNGKKNLECSRQALQLCKEAGFERGVGVALARIAHCHLNVGEEGTAARYFFEALRIFEKLELESDVFITLSNLSLIYARSGQYDSSIAIVKRCLAYQTRKGEKISIAVCLARLGKYTYELQRYDESLQYTTRASQIWAELGTYQTSLAESYLDISKVHQHYKDSAKARALIGKAQKIYENFGNKGGLMSCQMNLGLFAYNFGDVAKAITILEPVTKYYKEHGDPRTARHLNFLMTKFYAEQKRYKEIFSTLKLDGDYKDTSYRSIARNALSREQIRHDLEMKELAANKKMENLKIEAERKDHSKNLWLVLAVSLAVILLISAFFIYHHFRQKNIIAAQNNNLLKQQLLVSQMNPHFIFNSLNAVQSFIFRQESYRAGIYLKQFSELIRMILDFSTKDVIPLEDEISFLTNYLELQKVRFEDKLEYSMHIDPEIELCSVMIPPMLAQPFIENAIEHGIFHKDGKGLLSIRISLRGNSLIYEIEDDGIGLEESIRRRQNFKKSHRSLAIKITRERIAAMNSSDNDVELEILDKRQQHKERSGVYVKFATPFLIV